MTRATAVFLLFLQCCEVVHADSWPLFRGDPQNTGASKGTLPDKPALRWRFDTLTARARPPVNPASAPTTSTSSPSSSNVRDAIASTAAIVNGVVFVGCDDEHLYAIGLRDGQMRWRYKARGCVKSSPAVIGDTLYFGDDDGVLHALARDTGQPRWVFETGGQIISSVNTFSTPKEPDRIVVGSYDGILYCLSADDGRVAWKYETADRLHAAPAIAGGRALIAGCDGQLHVVRLADGGLERKAPLKAPCGSSAAVAGQLAVVGTQGNQVLGVNWQTGAVDWTFEDREHQLPYMSSAAIAAIPPAGRTPARTLAIIGGRDKRLRAHDISTGEPAWVFTAKARIESSAIVVGDRIFLAAGDGVLHQLELATGRETWRYETGNGFMASPAAAEGCLVIGDDEGVLYCFGAR